MIDVNRLNKHLTLDEYEEGRDTFNVSREHGISASRAAGIVFRSGRLIGKKELKAETGKLHTEIGRLRKIIKELTGSSPPKATDTTLPDVDVLQCDTSLEEIAIDNEGSIDNG